MGVGFKSRYWKDNNLDGTSTSVSHYAKCNQLSVGYTLMIDRPFQPDVPYGAAARELLCSSTGTLYWGDVPKNSYYVRVDLINRNSAPGTRVSVADWRVKY